MKSNSEILKAGTILFWTLLLSLNGWGYSLTRFDQNWCAASFPTAYVSGSFAIVETSATEFGQNQSNKTLFFDVPTGFEFNTTGGTYSVTGTSANDITAISISAITTSRITVKVTTSNSTQINLNTITVNCQIRAATAGSSGSIYRTGGTLKLGGVTTNPTSSESLGNLIGAASMAFTSCTAAHSTTGTVAQSSTGNEILQVQVVMTGTCNLVNLTQLDFSTDGGNSSGTNLPATNISNARVYYTGTTNTFSATGLFGSYSSPNGSFSITGSQALTAGTNYFWLVYDVPATAIAGQELDASCSSLTISGGIGAKVPTAQSPAGSRMISGTTTFYSRASGNWTDTNNWSVTDGGASCSCTPTLYGNTYINTGHAIVLNSPDTVDFLTIRSGATLSDNGSSLLRVNSNLTTALTGKFTSTSAITVVGNLTTSGTGANTTSAAFTVQGTATIGSGTSITSTGSAANNITLQGAVTINGTLSSGTGGATIILNGASSQTIAGSGTINGSGNVSLTTSAKSISAGSALSINPTIAITGAITVTNNGTVSVAGNITGSVAGSTWTNASNSTLNIAGALLSTGTLTATANPNTVEYNLTGAQNIKATTYNILRLSGSGNKTLAGNTTINNELNISGSATAIAGTNTLNGAGALTMTGTTALTIAKTGVTVPELTGTYTLTGGTITFNGAAAAIQTLRGVSYNHVILSGSNASSQFDLSLVTTIPGDFTVQSQSQIINNAALTVSGNFVYSSSLSSTLANNMNVSGTTNISAGTLTLNTKQLTSAGLTLASGATINATNSAINITNSGSWTNNGGIFTSTGSTVTLSGNGAQTIGGSSSTTFNHLTINSSYTTIPQITLGISTQVNGTLNFTAGTVNLGGNTLTLGASAASTGTLTLTSGWTYNGTFKRWYSTSTVADGAISGLLPLGTLAHARYSYINAPSVAPTSGGTVSVSHTGSSGLSTVSFTDGVTDIDNRYDAYWTINTADGLAGGTWNITTTGTGLSALSSVSALRLTNSGGVTGTHVAASGTVSNPQVARSGLTLAQLANNFYWGYSQTALPVELLNFEATDVNHRTELKWSTASETNSSHFTLYRAGADLQYEYLCTVQSNGNASTISRYSYTDTAPLKGVNYYKLTETDLDGTEQFLSVAVARFKSGTQPVILNTRVSGELQLLPGSTNAALCSVRIYDSGGRLVYNADHETGTAGEKLVINCTALPAGVYVLVMTNGEEPFRGRFVKD